MAHGSGGESMQKLISEMFAKAYPDLQSDQDAACVYIAEPKFISFTTDSFVIDPIFFPGGDIGSLAVHGTVNDLAMRGSQPKYISIAFILEEGFPMKDLERIVHSIAEASAKAGVKVVTGDTKVVGRGQGHGIYINTSGIGEIRAITKIVPDVQNVGIGHKIIVSGDIGRHGMAIMSVRNGMELDPPILSDSAPLNGMVRELYYDYINPLCMRDATRGGVAAVLNEIARSAKLHIRIEEEKVPVDENVRGLAEILGLDPLHIANEGRFVLFVKPEDAEKAVSILQKFEGGEKAAIIGEVVAEHEKGLVTAKTLLGSEKPIHMPVGEILPRIC
ncbi:MAG: hydrogenase expression/formation protein HypE [Candidatus Paceibacterota bacterium]